MYCASPEHCQGALHFGYNLYSDETTLDLVFFSPLEDLHLQTSGTMETNGIRKLYEPFPVPILYVGRIEDLLGRVPPCHSFLASLTETPHLLFPTSMLLDRSRPLHSAVVTDQARDLVGVVTLTRSTPGCGSGRPQPRISGLSVAKTERIRRQSRSETSWGAAKTKKARKHAVDQI
jgi:hypothetical protein